MSALIYFASDAPLKEWESPHNRMMSVNEALAAGIEIPDILDLDAVDKDDPHMLLWSDSYVKKEDTGILEDSGFDDDISIRAMEKSEDVLTEKNYCACLEWPGFTKGRAQRLITYIREHLTFAQEIELWHIWMGSSYPPPQIQKSYIRLEELHTDAIEKLYHCEAGQGQPVAGYVKIQPEQGITEEELEREIHYCIVIQKSQADRYSRTG